MLPQHGKVQFYESKTTACLQHLKLLIIKALVQLFGARQHKRIGLCCAPLGNTGDDVGTRKPMGIGEVSL